ncbi:MAG TPA: thiamine phosphate synthase [Acidimicrobiales bacterium]|nr:thiamine phosphate synthase [Acidimicrobiales bacterium]
MADLEGRHLYLCVPDRPDLQRFVAACIDGGVDVVQLREKHLDDRALLGRASLVAEVCRDAAVPFILNDRPDLALAVGADGVHVGQDDVPPAIARRVLGDDAIIGLSTHAMDELVGSLDEPVTYVSAGPVEPTPTKPGRPGVGLDYIRFAVEHAGRQVWVTGGASPATVAGIVGAGARHVVAVRWLTEAADPAAAARQLRRALDNAIEEAEAGEVANPSPG